MIEKKLNKIYLFTYYLFGDYVSFKRFFLNNFFSILSIYFFNYFFVNYSIPINLSTIITDARVTLNKVQDAISSMPINVNERIGLLESRFNILADRIATLENRN